MMRDPGHPDDVALIELLLAELTGETQGVETTAAHVAGCLRCRSRTTELRTLRNAESAAAKSRQAAALEKLLGEERAVAEAAMGELLSGPSAWWRGRIFSKPEAMTYGLAAELVERSVSLLHTSPSEALEASAIAVDVAERLRVDAYPFDLVITARANAWREYAYTLFFIGRLKEAEDAVDVSEQLFRQTPVPEIELARTSLIRASLLLAWDRGSEAIPLAEQAGSVFQEFGDRPRYIKARLTEGRMRYRGGDLEGALAIWLELENDPTVQEMDDFGMLLHNIGHAYRDTNEFERARTYLDRAIAEYSARGMEVEKVRTRWIVGQMLVLTGDSAHGLPVLRKARREFEALGMELEAGLVGLEMAEALLTVGETDEVANVCRTILDRFVQQGMMSRAITALAYLREAVAADKATPAIVRDIREFLRALPQNPGRALPPPSA